MTRRYYPQVGHHVRVSDPANAYNGREAVIVSSKDFGELALYTVKVGETSFTLRRDQIRELRYETAR